MSRVWDRRFRLPMGVMRNIGEFGFQANNLIRTFEYPWVHEVSGCRAGMRVVDIGSGASGLPFVLAGEGVEMIAVDPLPEVPGADHWAFTQKDYARLNRAFGNRVRYIPKFLEDAGLESGSVDRVLCVSVIEHVPTGAVDGLMREVRRVLKPGGLFVATIDLFTDCAPFTGREENAWGRNMNVRELVERSGLRLVAGSRDELNGYPEFDAGRVAADAGKYLCGGVAMAQCVVLEKAGGADGGEVR